MPKRKPKRRRFTVLKVAVFLLAIPVIIVALILIRYYYIFDGLIQEKLGKNPHQQETEIYAFPTVLYPGKRFHFSDLQAKLRRVGYLEEAPGQSGEVLELSDR